MNLCSLLNLARNLIGTMWFCQRRLKLNIKGTNTFGRSDIKYVGSYRKLLVKYLERVFDDMV